MDDRSKRRGFILILREEGVSAEVIKAICLIKRRERQERPLKTYGLIPPKGSRKVR